MNRLKQSFKVSLRNKHTHIGFFLILTILGFFDSFYLTLIHYANIAPPCSLAHGCERVLTSPYATVGPIPVAVLGIIFYIGLLLFAGIYLHTRANKFVRLLFIATLFGFLYSLYLVYLQGVIIHAYCQYCLLSEFLSTLLFLTGFFLFRTHK